MVSPRALPYVSKRQESINVKLLSEKSEKKNKKQPIQKREKIFTVAFFRRSQFCRSESNVRGLMEIPRKLYATSYKITGVILQHEKFLQFDWLRAVIFQLNLKYLLVKITNLLRVVLQTNNSIICT